MDFAGHLFLDELDTAEILLVGKDEDIGPVLSRSWVCLETRRYPTVLDGFSGTICSRSMKTPLSLINDIVSFGLFNAIHCTISKPETFVFSAIPWNGFSHAPNAHSECGRPVHLAFPRDPESVERSNTSTSLNSS